MAKFSNTMFLEEAKFSNNLLENGKRFLHRPQSCLKTQVQGLLTASWTFCYALATKDPDHHHHHHHHHHRHQLEDGWAWALLWDLGSMVMNLLVPWMNLLVPWLNLNFLHCPVTVPFELGAGMWPALAAKPFGAAAPALAPSVVLASWHVVAGRAGLDGHQALLGARSDGPSPKQCWGSLKRAGLLPLLGLFVELPLHRPVLFGDEGCHCLFYLSDSLCSPNRESRSRLQSSAPLASGQVNSILVDWPLGHRPLEFLTSRMSPFGLCCHFFPSWKGFMIKAGNTELSPLASQDSHQATLRRTFQTTHHLGFGVGVPLPGLLHSWAGVQKAPGSIQRVRPFLALNAPFRPMHPGSCEAPRPLPKHLGHFVMCNAWAMTKEYAMSCCSKGSSSMNAGSHSSAKLLKSSSMDLEREKTQPPSQFKCSFHFSFEPWQFWPPPQKRKNQLNDLPTKPFPSSPSSHELTEWRRSQKGGSSIFGRSQSENWQKTSWSHSIF